MRPITLKKPALGQVFLSRAQKLESWAILAAVNSNPESYDLVIIPEGLRLTVGIQAFGDNGWIRVERPSAWQVSLYDADGRSAKWWGQVPSVEFIIALAKDVRNRGSNEIVHVHYPSQPLPQADKESLAHWGVRLVQT